MRINPQTVIRKMLRMVYALTLILITLVILVKVDRTVDCSGVITPENNTEIRAEISGIIEKVYVKDGETITQGQTLLKLRDTELRLSLKKEEINYQIAKLRFQSEWKDKKRNYQSKKRLYLKHLISYEKFMNAKHDLDLLQIKKLELEQMRLTLNDISNKIKKTIIKSRMDGKIIFDETKLTEGAVVQQGEIIGNVLNYRGKNLIARVLIPENSISRVSLSNTVRIFVTAFPYTKYQVINGKVIYISPVSENGFVKAKISLEKQGVKVNGVFKPLSYGMTLKAKIIIGKEPVFYRLLGIKREY